MRRAGEYGRLPHADTKQISKAANSTEEWRTDCRRLQRLVSCRPMIAYCLADAFNLNLWPTGRPPNYPDVRDGIQELVAEVLEAVPSAREVTVRLYGGWHGESPLSQVDLRHLVSLAIDATPKRLGKQRLRLQIADHPVWDSSIPVLWSVRHSRLVRVKANVTTPPNCPAKHACTLPAFRSWAAGGCPESTCRVRLQHVARRHRQKMVDTLLTADALAIANDALADIVVLASDDDDMIPALLALAASQLTLIYLRRRSPLEVSPSAYYAGILEREGTQIRNW